MHPSTNTPIFRFSIGANNYQGLESIFKMIHQSKCIACSTGIVNDSVADQINEQNMTDIFSYSTLSKAELKIIPHNDDKNYE